jgi:hypothetical protein
LRLKIKLKLDNAANFLVGALDRGNERFLADLICFALDHHDRVGGTGNHHVQLALRESTGRGWAKWSTRLTPR